jgi:DNA primase
MKGCCPFHNEKTPSFYVYEDGQYHCFGCGAHGDAISFVMQTEGAGFMEAVERLAVEAGMDVPKPSPEAAEAERRRIDLGAVLQSASDSYRRRLFLPEGRHALAYLLGRGLSDDTIRRFGLGWSGEGRGSLAADLARGGVTTDQLVECGLMRRDDETGRVSDLFFNRVMFPIRDRRGRVISFGGRILSDGQPKYVNGPETALFSKRRTLYGLDLAREAVRGGAALLVVEGYMDVIALAQAGIGGAVAPLGTALTEEQLEELWRLAPAPVLCFDGDVAGSRAAARAAELALPMLAPDRSLKLARLPAGEDPDTLVRRGGTDGMAAVLAAALPLADALFDLLREGGETTPEQRAAFRTRLENATRRIPDKALAAEYRRTLLDRFFAGRNGGRRPAAARSLPRPAPASNAVMTERNRILTAILLRHPMLLRDVEPAYVSLDLPSPLASMRGMLLDWADSAEILDSEALIAHLTASGLQAEVDKVLAPVPMPLPVCASPTALPAEAEEGWYHYFGLMRRELLDVDVENALARYRSEQNDHNHRVLRNLSIVRERLKRAQFDEDTEAQH